MLRNYLDGSPDHKNDNARVYGIHGVLAPIHVWHKIQSKWEDALACCGVARFHATDLNNLEQDYAGWTAWQRERLMTLLVGVIQSHIRKIKLVGSVVVLDDWRRLTLERQQRLANPYQFCVTWAMLQSTWRSAEDFNEKEIEFIFDHEQKQVEHLNEAYEAVRKMGEDGHLCIGLTRADHRKVTPVQVADLFAYEAYKYAIGKLEGKLPEDIRWPIAQLKELIDASKAAWFDYHSLMLVSDVNGEYERELSQIRKEFYKTHKTDDC